MSNRSAKLLLEVAQTLEQHFVREPPVKLGSRPAISFHPRLAEEIVVWARGYRENLSRIKARPKLPPGVYTVVVGEDGNPQRPFPTSEDVKEELKARLVHQIEDTGFDGSVFLGLLRKALYS